MGIISRLFGGSDTAKQALDLADDSIRGIGSWIDNKSYTNQEQAVDLGKAVDTSLELVKIITDENGPARVTRRYMAWGIVGGILLIAFVCIGVILITDPVIVVVEKVPTVISNPRIDQIIGLVSALKLGWAFTAVVIAYFGVPFVRGRSEK